MKFVLRTLAILLLLAFTACGTDEPPAVPTTTPETQATQGQATGGQTPAPAPETATPQQTHTPIEFRRTISRIHFIDNSNNLRERRGGAFVMGDVDEILPDCVRAGLVRLTNGELTHFSNWGGEPLLIPYAKGSWHIEDFEIQTIFQSEGATSHLQGFYLLDNQGRLWFFPEAREELRFNNVERSFEFKIMRQGNSLAFMTAHLYEATHGRALRQPTYEELRARVDTHGYFRITDPFVLMENVIAINRVHRNHNTADFLVLTGDGYNYIITDHTRLSHIFPELFDRGSDMFIDFGTSQLPIVRLPFRNLVYVEHPFGSSGLRIEVDIYGNLHTYGRGTLGDGIESTNMPRRADNLLSNVAQAGIFHGSKAALTSEGNLYMWGERSFITPTRVLENVSYINISGTRIYALMNDGQLFELYGFRDGELAKSLSLFDIKLPQRRIIGK